MNPPGGFPHGQPVIFPTGQGRPGFHRRGRVAGNVIGFLHYQIGLGKPLFHVAPSDGQGRVNRQVAPGVNRDGIGVQGRVRLQVKGQRPVFHPDQGQRLPGGVIVNGGHRGHFVPHKTDSRIQGQCVRRNGRHRTARHVKGSDYRQHAGDLGRGVSIDADDVGVGVGAAQDVTVEHSRQFQIGGILGSPGQFLRQIPPDYALAYNG